MSSKIISSRPDRRHAGLFKITLVTGVQGYRVRVKGILDRRYKLAEYDLAVHDLEAARKDQRLGGRVVATAEAGRTPVAEVIREWGVQLGRLEEDGYLQHGTVINYRSSIDYLRKVHGDLPIAKLGISQLQIVITRGRTTGIDRSDGKPGRKWAKETHRLFTITVKLFLDFATERGYVPVNIARGDKAMRGPKQTAITRREKDHWTTEEMNELMVAFADEPLAVAYHLGLAGLRLGEVAGLRWDDVNFEQGFFVIRNTRVQHRDGVQEKMPKSGKSRDYPLGDDLLVEALKTQRQRQRADQMMNRQGYRRSGYVVTTRLGEPYQPSSIRQAWERFLHRNGYRHISFHGSRHSFATDAANSVSLAAVKDMLGHADLRTTGIYLHTDRASLLAASRAAAQARRAAGKGATGGASTPGLTPGSPDS